MAKSQQRYISNELTHFVGRKKLSDYCEQYEILCKILKDREIRPKKRDSNLSVPIIKRNTNPNVKLSSNKKYLPEVVCFCDIPLDDLKIHSEKYGVFGLSFTKDFIVGKGGVPVHYIPREASDILSYLSNGENTKLTTAGTFDNMHKKFMKIRKDLGEELRNFLYVYFFSCLIFFDHNLSDEHEENYYFEREWRIFNRLKFKVKNIKRILLPEEYAKQFRKDFPKYYGQVTFLQR